MHFGITFIDAFFISIAIVSYALYQALMKRFSFLVSLIILFWLHTISYVGYIAVYFFRAFVLEHDVYAFRELIYNFTLYNAPLYFILGICFTGSLVIYRNLVKEYEISFILPFSYISIIFTTLAFFMLGEPFNWIETLGVLIICCGALVIGFEKNVHNRPETFPIFQRPLLLQIILYGIFKAIFAVVMLLVTQKTSTQQMIKTSLQHIFPFSEYDSFYASLGTRFFMMLCLFIFIHHKASYRGKILPILREHWRFLIPLSVMFLISTYAYQVAYFLTPDKTVLAGVSKFNVPVILVIGYSVLKEQITLPKIIGSTIIVLGGVVILLQ